jgi:D-alanyl-D-alanine carboxypeptidase
MTRRILAVVVGVVCATGSATAASTPALKPIDPAALQAAVEGLAKELMLPGAMVLLKTPLGNVVFGHGTTELGVSGGAILPTYDI